MTFMNHNLDAITIDTRGPVGEKYLMNWRWPRDADFAPLWLAANGVVNEASAFFMSRETINGDPELSDNGKKSRLENLAKERIGQIGKMQKRLNQAAEDIAAAGRNLAAVKPYGNGPEGATTAVLDAEIARALRELPTDERDKIAKGLMSGQDQRVIDAVLRLPGFVTGVSENMRGLIEAAAIRREHPEAVMKQEALTEAAQGAQTVIRGAAGLLLEHSGLDLQAQMRALGGEWRGILRGREDAMDALARRYSTPEAA